MDILLACDHFFMCVQSIFKWPLVILKLKTNKLPCKDQKSWDFVSYSFLWSSFTNSPDLPSSPYVLFPVVRSVCLLRLVPNQWLMVELCLLFLPLLSFHWFSWILKECNYLWEIQLSFNFVWNWWIFGGDEGNWQTDGFVLPSTSFNSHSCT